MRGWNPLEQLDGIKTRMRNRNENLTNIRAEGIADRRGGSGSLSHTHINNQIDIDNQIGYSRRNPGSCQIWGYQRGGRSIPNLAFAFYATLLSSLFGLFQGWVPCDDASHLSAGW